MRTRWYWRRIPTITERIHAIAEIGITIGRVNEIEIGINIAMTIVSGRTAGIISATTTTVRAITAGIKHHKLTHLTVTNAVMIPDRPHRWNDGKGGFKTRKRPTDRD